MEERFEGLSVRPPDRRQSWPAGQEITKQHRVDVVEPFQGLRIVLLECVGYPDETTDLYPLFGEWIFAKGVPS